MIRTRTLLAAATVLLSGCMMMGPWGHGGDHHWGTAVAKTDSRPTPVPAEADSGAADTAAVSVAGAVKAEARAHGGKHGHGWTTAAAVIGGVSMTIWMTIMMAGSVF